MSLNPATGGDLAQAAVDRQVQRVEDRQPLLTPAQVALELSEAYDTYAKEGTLPGANLTVGGDKSILDAGWVTDNTTATISRIAQSICDYWSTNNTPGSPAHGGSSVVSVTINGSAVLAAMTQAITDAVTDDPDVGVRKLYDVTEPVVKTIPCVIIELIEGVPTPFPETIS